MVGNNGNKRTSVKSPWKKSKTFSKRSQENQQPQGNGNGGFNRKGRDQLKTLKNNRFHLSSENISQIASITQTKLHYEPLKRTADEINRYRKAASRNSIDGHHGGIARPNVNLFSACKYYDSPKPSDVPLPPTQWTAVSFSAAAKKLMTQSDADRVRAAEIERDQCDVFSINLKKILNVQS